MMRCDIATVLWADFIKIAARGAPLRHDVQDAIIILNHSCRAAHYAGGVGRAAACKGGGSDLLVGHACMQGQGVRRGHDAIKIS